MKYVDGYVLPVAQKNLQAYRRMAQKAGKIWREHGALEFSGMRWRRSQGEDGDVVSAHDQAQSRRDGGFFLDCIQVARASR